MIPKRLIDVTHDLQDTGELVLYDAEGKRLLVLNLLGAYVWQRIDGERDVAALVDDTSAQFPDVPRETVSTDIDVFIASLVEHGVLALAPATDHAP